MPIARDDTIASLERLGLSTYESKAYLAAIGQPPITCYKLAQLSGVPRARIYDIVDRLAAKGLLIFQSGDKTLLTAANYERFLAQKESEVRENLNRLRKSLAAIPSAESSGIWSINGRSQVLQTARDLMAAAERYVYVEALAADVQELLPTMQRIRQRKIDIHGIYCGDLPQGLPGLAKHLGETELICSEIAVIVDGEHALIGCTQPEKAASAAMTQNKGIIHIAREYIRHEVFLNSLVSGRDATAERRSVRKYRSLMQRLP